MNRKLAIYARQSREKDTNNSIEDQIRHGKLKAKELGLEYLTYIDHARSAAHDNFENRPDFQQLLKDVANGIIGAVFVLDHSRLSRNETTFLVIKKTFEQNKIILHTSVDAKETDYSDPSQVFVSSLLTLLAQKQIHETSFKIKSVLKKRAEEGKAHGAPIKPYGYTCDSQKMLVVEEDEAKNVRLMYQMCLMGMGSGTIAKKLTQDGILTKTQKHYLNSSDATFVAKNKVTKWAPNVVLNILKNPLYKGHRIHMGEVFDAPPIVSLQTWEMVQEEIKKHRNSPGLSKHNYLLKNLSYCARCGSKFCGRTRDNKRDHAYYCASRKKNRGHCGIRSINIDTLESLVWYTISTSDIIISTAKEEVLKLKNPHYLEALKKERSVLEKSISDETNKKLKIIDMSDRTMLTNDEMANLMGRHVEKIAEYNRRLQTVITKLTSDEELVVKINEVEEFINQWGSIVFSNDFQLQRTFVTTFVERVLIAFDDDTEIYTVKVFAKLPDISELIILKVNLNGTLINDPVDSGHLDLKENAVPDNLVHTYQYEKQHCDITDRMMRRAERSDRHNRI